MQHRSTELFGGIIFFFFAVFAFVLGYTVIEGVFVPMLFAAIFSVVFSPAYHWLLRKTKSKGLSSLLTCFFLLFLVLALISFAIYLAIGEVVSITKLFTDNFELQRLDFLTDQQQFTNLVNQTVASLNEMVKNIPYINTSLSEIVVKVLENIPPLVQQISAYTIGFIKLTFSGAADWIVQLVVFFIAFFYLLIDGNDFTNYAFRLLPINALHERQISKRFSNLCYSWIVVSLLIAFIQGSLATIGFAIIGVPSPFIWGVITMFASFIPFIGAAIIWVTMGIIYIILGKYGAGIFILVWGAIMISTSDNILRPFLLKDSVKIHPLILFLAVTGGFYAFKVPGLIIGPLVVVFISTLLYIYELEFQQTLDEFHNPSR